MHCCINDAGAVVEKLKNDRHVVLAAVQQNYRALEHGSDELKNDCDIVLTAV